MAKSSVARTQPPLIRRPLYNSSYPAWESAVRHATHLSVRTANIEDGCFGIRGLALAPDNAPYWQGHGNTQQKGAAT